MSEVSRRERLIQAALELFVHHGVKKTSVDEVAESANVAKGSVYLEFASKTELFRSVAKHVADEILAQAVGVASRDLELETAVLELLLAKFWRIYELVHARPHARELLDAKDEGAADIFRDLDKRFAKLLDELLVEATKERRWSPPRGTSPQEVAHVLLRAAHGNSYGAEQLSRSAYRARLLVSVQTILRTADAVG